MATPDHTRVKTQIDRIVAHLVEVGLAGDQNFAVQRDGGAGLVAITFPQAEHVSIAMRNLAYPEIYAHLVAERAFSAQLPDGALVQMMYLFVGGRIKRHRLAFFPAPHLEEFQNNPDIYLEDEIYADVVARNIVPFPLRFDYDDQEDRHVEVDHAKSHLTLGQYAKCRIPVTSPLTPVRFIDFILRNFYHTAFQRYADKLPPFSDVFDECIDAAERGVIHIQVPA